ncbi:MAG: hypothetical protein COB42_08645 [Sulfurimonas sp.]|nr:MAG: hypothetical protein COB42_08645 [Sulfurimonas sp.]
MIGLMFILIVLAYIALSIVIVSKVYKKFTTKKSKYIAIAIMVLIPTWDVVLGFPVFAYLCVFESETKIYKSVDNVEGFYIGKYESNNDKYNPLEPYKGYKYIEYQETNNKKITGKYFRNYWLDNNTSTLCVNPKPKLPNSAYTHKFRSGKCIAKEEISRDLLSRWEVDGFYKKIELVFLGILFTEASLIRDRFSGETLLKDYSARWSGGWVNSLISGIPTASLRFTGHSVSCSFKNLGSRERLNKTLKTKKEER